jgi:hypothetical protein
MKKIKNMTMNTQYLTVEVNTCIRSLVGVGCAESVCFGAEKNKLQIFVVLRVAFKYYLAGL